uniref:Uncharacterized protein n=1 Tax=Cacopsylla melanoneura TaxID=428564 RepID=A0A8D9F403_9HEMI
MKRKISVKLFSLGPRRRRNRWVNKLSFIISDMFSNKMCKNKTHKECIVTCMKFIIVFFVGPVKKRDYLQKVSWSFSPQHNNSSLKSVLQKTIVTVCPFDTQC